MSLFRSLQNSPATISIFHNAHVPTLARVYASLEKAYYQLNDNKNLFQIDLMAKQMPTYEAFRQVYLQCVHSEASKDVLKACFPLLNDKLHVAKDKSVTIKGATGINTDRGFKVFSETEYEKIHEAFDVFVDATTPDIDPVLLFRAPLVVDWDQNLIACDEAGLDLILQKYREAESAEHLSAA